MRRILFLFAFALLFLVPVLYFGSLGRAVSDWVASYYHLNYTYGFVRRGLVGTLALPFGELKLFAFWGTFTASLLLALTFTFLTEDVRLYLLFLLSPATALHMGFDVGRYDHFNLLLLATSLLLIRRRGPYWPIPVLTALGVLTHEAYVLYALPVVVAALWEEDRFLALLTATVGLGVLLALLVWGKGPPSTVPEGAVPGAYEVLSLGVSDVLKTNLSYVLSEFPRRPWDFLLPLLLLLGYAVLYLRSTPSLPLPVRLSPFSGLLLFAVGYDYPRWVSILVIVLLLTMAYRNVPPKVGRLGLVLMLSSVLGPLGAGHYAFPLLEALLFRTPPY